MANSKERKPRQKTLDSVFAVVKAKAGMNRKLIILESNHTAHCVDLCLDSLVAGKKILKQFVRMSGPYKVYSYAVNE